MKHWFQLFIRACALSAALWLTGCHKPSEPLPAAQLPTVTVRAQPVQTKIYSATEEVVGTVRAKLRATLEAKVSGRIEKMPVSAGQLVKKGDLLAQLEVREVQAKLDQAKAVREQSARDRQRLEALLQQKAVTQQEYDAVLARFRVSEAAVSEAQTMLDYATITAPFDGVITRKLAEVGDLASPGRALLELEDPNALRLEADVPEALLERVQAGGKLPVRIGALTNAVPGTVSEIAPIADPNSRTFRVKLDMPPNAGLRSGQFGRLVVPVGESSNLRVPASALVRRGQMEMVFVAAKNQAQLRLVKTGRRLGDEIEILSGLEAGELIVTEGAAALVDGQPVEVKP
jgi:RND family efflux transporter MFP subunit